MEIRKTPNGTAALSFVANSEAARYVFVVVAAADVMDRGRRYGWHVCAGVLRSCPREFSTTENKIVMIPLSVAALTNARKPDFSALIFFGVKAPTGNSVTT